MARFRMKNGSGEREYRFISEDPDRHGNVRIYFRQPGRAKIRLREIPGTQEFDREYREALAGKLKSAASADRRAAAGTFKWLCERYYESAEFKGLDASTRRVRRLILDKFNWRDGAKPYRLMEMRHVRQRRDELADRPEAANGLVKALRQVFKFAIANDYANRNPAADVSYMRSANPDGFHTWSVEQLEQYRAKWPLGTRARLAFDLIYFTGQRRSDIVRLGRQHVRDGWLRFTQFKNRNRQPVKMEIPILPELQASIDAFPARGLTFLETAFGKPFSANGLGNKLRRWCNAAGLPHCSAHGLRKAGACFCAENGATEAQLMAIFGWRSAKQASHYIKQMQRKRLAGESMHMLVPRQNANETVPLLSGDAESGTKTDGKSLTTKGAKA